MLLLPLLCASLEAGAVRKSKAEGEFDSNMLQIEEQNFLGKSAADVSVTTDEGIQPLSRLVNGNPTLLLLAYYSCSHSCPLTIKNLAKTELDASTEDYNVLVLSFDERDTLATMNDVRSSMEGLASNWTFGLLKPADARKLADSVGFKYFFSEQDQIYVHPAVMVFLSPESQVMRYLFGAEPQAQDIELALIESRNRSPRLNEIVDMVRLTCFQFDKSRSRYSLHPTIIFGGAGLGVLALVGIAAMMVKKD